MDMQTGLPEFNKDRFLFRSASIPFISEVILQYSVMPYSRIVQALMAMQLPKYKKELHEFLSILNYLSRISTMTSEICKPSWKVTSVKQDGHVIACIKIIMLWLKYK